MIYNKALKGKKITLRMVKISDCDLKYLHWLNNKKVNQFLETRWEKQTLKKITDFVDSMRKSDHSYLFAILYQNKHVGNIKLGPINPIHKFADISYFIGDESAWGKGVTSEAIGIVVKFAFKKLKLNRLQAGAYEKNIGSCKVLLKNEFKQEAVLRKKYLTKEREIYRFDTFWFIKKRLGNCK